VHKTVSHSKKTTAAALKTTMGPREKKNARTNPISKIIKHMKTRIYEKYAPSGTPGNEPNQTQFEPRLNPFVAAKTIP
jgi:hypothetical protein